MKKHINPFKAILFFAFAIAPFMSMAANGDNVEKKHTISKSYNVGPDDRLSIENSFGNVTISTWDKNEIQIDIEISVHASTEEKAQQMLDQIHVSDHQGDKEIDYKTDIGKMSGKNNWDKNDDTRKFYVDYKVSMPSKNPLRIENSFGKISIPDFVGTADITSKFGELIAGNMPNAKIVHVEFGKAEVGQLNNTEVIFKFNGNSDVAGLSGNSKVDVQFCSHVNLSVIKITDLSLFQSYSSINLKVPADLSAKFDVYTNFGSFKNNTDFNISEEREDDNSGPKFDKNYSGSVGGGAGRIKIKSSFGSVRLTNANDTSGDKDDDQDDDKDKDKDDGKVKM